jgi:hypothetical protein
LGQYYKPKTIEECVQVIEQAAGRSLAVAVRNEIEVAVRKATGAIQRCSPNVLLDYEVQHWDYLARYRPQQAYMANAMAGGGRCDDFCNPKFVKQWSHFIYSVLNMGPQLVHNELITGNYQTLIYEHKRVEEGKPGIMYWEVTGASRARA